MHRLSIAAIVSAIAFLFGAPAYANLTYTSGQMEDGPKFVIVTGEFEMNDDLSAFTQIVAATAPIYVSFNSPGGAVYKAMDLGRLIRQYGLSTIEPKMGTGCVSACTLAFLGGVKRFAEAGAIGVHRSSFAQGIDVSGTDATVAIQKLTADIITYMIAMGADPSLLQVAYNYGSDDMRYLSSSEMAHYRVTTPDGDEAPAVQPPQVAQIPSPPPPGQPVHVASPPSVEATAKPSVPVARTGEVRHANGFVFLLADADAHSARTAKLMNGDRVEILGVEQRWYRVRVGDQIGFLHATWVKVDQFEPTRFGGQFIQIASFNAWPDVEQFLKYETVPVAVHLASNGWYAVTLADTFDAKHGAQVLARMKSQELIPPDSFLTYGNTYAVKVR